MGAVLECNHESALVIHCPGPSASMYARRLDLEELSPVCEIDPPTASS